MSRRLAWLTVALLSVVVGRAGFAAPAAPKTAPPATPQSKQCTSPGKTPQRKGLCKGKAAIRRALAEKTATEFVEVPLFCLIQFLKDYHRIEIQFDKKALADAGVTDVPVTCNVKGISLAAALKLMLGNLNLTFEVGDEMLTITTPEQAESHLVTDVYDVADLVTFRDEKGKLWEDYEALSDVITSTVRPLAWKHVGGTGDIAGHTFASAKVLVILQTAEAHEQIAALLKQIRAVVKRNGGAAEPPRRTPGEPIKKGPSEGMGDVGRHWLPRGTGKLTGAGPLGDVKPAARP